jgi:hypothetical protein
VRIEGNSRTLYLEIRGSKFEVRGFEDAVQGRVKTAKMNVPVRNQSEVGR